MRYIHIVWPDDYNVSEKQIRNWLSDAIANGEISQSEIDPDTPDTVDFGYAAKVLHESGLITISRL